MAHKLFFDTNIFLNIILEEVDCESCTRLLDSWNTLTTSPFAESAGASFLSFADIAYVLRKKYGSAQVKRCLEIFYRHITEIVPNNEQNMLCALNSKGPDFEDVLQFVCAAQNGYDVIVTCNKKHFEKIEIDPSWSTSSLSNPAIMTPDEVLSELF